MGPEAESPGEAPQAGGRRGEPEGPGLPRRRLAVALALVVPSGFAAEAVRRGSGGAVFYEIFWILLVLLLRPAWSPRAVAAGVYGATAAVEVAQLWHPPWLEGVRATFLGHTLLGATFHPFDFFAYAIGCAAGLGLVFLLGSCASPGSSSSSRSTPSSARPTS